jgi:hypothetical protein
LLSAPVFFVLLQLGLALPIRKGLTELRDPIYEYRLHQLQRRRRFGDDILVVMLGSSRTLMGLRGQQAGAELSACLGRRAAVMNFGAVGGGPLTELLTWRRLRDAGVRPDFVAIEVLPTFLLGTEAKELSEEQLPLHWLQPTDLALVERFAGKLRSDLRAAWRRSQAIPWYTFRVGLLNRLAPTLVPNSHRQAIRQDLDETGSPLNAEMDWPSRDPALMNCVAYQQHAVAMKRLPLSGPSCAALGELLESCRREGVPTAMILMPEGPRFRSWYPADFRRRLDDWLNALRDEQGAQLIDARQWFDEDAFWDSHHLRPAAAVRFSRRLAREVIAPRLAPAAGTTSPR